MSLENTRRAGRPATQELNPSRYGVKVGEIEVLVISDGVLPLPTTMWGTMPIQRSAQRGWTICSCLRMLSTGR